MHLGGLQSGCNSSSTDTMSAHHVRSMGFSGAAPLWCDGEAGSLWLMEGQTVGPLAIPGEIFTLREPSSKQQDVCLDQMFLQGWAAFLTLCTKTVRPTEYSLYHR